MKKNYLLLLAGLFLGSATCAPIEPVTETEVAVSTCVTFGFYSFLSAGLTYLSMVAADLRYIEYPYAPHLVATASALGTVFATYEHYSDLASRTPARLEERAVRIVEGFDAALIDVLEADAQTPHEFKAVITQTTMGNTSFDNLARRFNDIRNELEVAAQMIKAASTINISKKPLARIYNNYYMASVRYARWACAESTVWSVSQELNNLQQHALIEVVDSHDNIHPVIAIQRIFAPYEQPFISAFEQLNKLREKCRYSLQLLKQVNLQDLTDNGQQSCVDAMNQLEHLCSKMEELLVMIKGDQRYYRELEEKKRAEEEARRIQLERQRLQAQLELEERRVKAEEERIRIERERACIEAERLRTEQQRLNDERRREEERR